MWKAMWQKLSKLQMAIPSDPTMLCAGAHITDKLHVSAMTYAQSTVRITAPSAVVEAENKPKVHQ